jgi:hypothetical protein
MKALMERDEAIARAGHQPRAINKAYWTELRGLLPRRIVTGYAALIDGVVQRTTVIEDCLQKAARYFHQKDITLVFRSDKRRNSIFSIDCTDIVDPSEFERKPDEPKAS